MTEQVKEGRETFFRRLEPFFPRRTLLKIQLAYTLSKYWHRAQHRKEILGQVRRMRTFEHIRRVTLVLIDEVQIFRPEMIISALLHDTIEDTKGRENIDLTPEMIEENFGEDVITTVKTLSKDPKEGYLERFHCSVDWRPYVIKACDRLDNLRSLIVPGVEWSFVRKQCTETEDKYLPLFDRMLGLTPNEYKQNVTELRDLIRMELAKNWTVLRGAENAAKDSTW
jgi:(p)ppGpp synthase/HD superfamily hydrolase